MAQTHQLACLTLSTLLSLQSCLTMHMCPLVHALTSVPRNHKIHLLHQQCCLNNMNTTLSSKQHPHCDSCQQRVTHCRQRSEQVWQSFTQKSSPQWMQSCMEMYTTIWFRRHEGRMDLAQTAYLLQQERQQRRWCSPNDDDAAPCVCSA